MGSEMCIRDSLWSNSKNYQAKQFIDFGNWTLLDKTLERTKASIYDSTIISTNKKYFKEVRKQLNKNNIKKYKIVLEPAKRNTAPAILSTALIKDIPNNQPLMFSLIFLVTKYPYSLDGDVGLIPNIKMFSSVKFDLFLLIALLKTLIFSIK